MRIESLITERCATLLTCNQSCQTNVVQSSIKWKHLNMSSVLSSADHTWEVLQICGWCSHVFSQWDRLTFSRKHVIDLSSGSLCYHINHHAPRPSLSIHVPPFQINVILLMCQTVTWLRVEAQQRPETFSISFNQPAPNIPSRSSLFVHTSTSLTNSFVFNN